MRLLLICAIHYFVCEIHAKDNSSNVPISNPDRTKKVGCYFIHWAVSIVITCYRTWNVGPQIETLYDEVRAFELPITLDINELEFPTERMESNWYEGHTDIEVLNIYLENVTSIEENAFNVQAFWKMTGLVIYSLGAVEIKDGAFNGLDAMRHLSLWSDVAFKYSGNCLLQFAQRTLGLLVLSHFDWNFNDIFCGVKMSRLVQAEIHFTPVREREVGHLRALSQHNLSSLVVVEKLDMRSCGIDVIMDGAFDYIGETLGDLNLANNRIKRMNIDLFRVFFDSSLRTKFYLKILRISNNPIDCECDRHLLMNVTLITLGYTPKRMGHLLCRPKYGACEVGEDDVCEEREHPQLIHLDGKPFVNDLTDTYAYPNFQLKIHRSEVKAMMLVNQHRPRPYRLWIHNLNDPGNRRRMKCPNRGWIAQSIDCLLLSNLTERIAIERYLQRAEMTLVCVIFWTLTKRSWPLHCQTLHKALVVQVERPFFRGEVSTCVWLVLGLMMLALGLGFLGAIAIGCWNSYDLRKRRKILSLYDYYSCGEPIGKNTIPCGIGLKGNSGFRVGTNTDYVDIDGDE